MSTQLSKSVRASGAPVVDMKLEGIIIPVSDVDRAKHFYESLGWRLDADFTDGDFRGIQMTPPGSPCSILFGKGITTAAPGSFHGLMLIVYDVDAARADLIKHGADVSDVFHFASGLHANGNNERVPGPDPEHQSYRSWASFSDPDGNGWLLQEIKTRLPGRIAPGPTDITDATSLSELLQETEKNHGAHEASVPKHHWAVWYSAFIVAREHGKTSDEAAEEADLEVERMNRR